MNKSISIGIFSFIFLAFSFILTACNQTDETNHYHPSQDSNQNHAHHHQELPMNQKLTITFSTDPKEAKANQPTTLKATVKADDKPITDAKVELEVWKEKEEHQKLSTSMEEEGVYQIQHTFNEAGTYTVVVHVTTPHVHQMITQSIPVDAN